MSRLIDRYLSIDLPGRFACLDRKIYIYICLYASLYCEYLLGRAFHNFDKLADSSKLLLQIKLISSLITEKERRLIIHIYTEGIYTHRYIDR